MCVKIENTATCILTTIFTIALYVALLRMCYSSIADIAHYVGSKVVLCISSKLLRLKDYNLYSKHCTKVMKEVTKKVNDLHFYIATITDSSHVCEKSSD